MGRYPFADWRLPYLNLMSIPRISGAGSAARVPRGPKPFSLTRMSAPSRHLVWLFDIDGTLVHTEGAGKAALEAAFHEVFGVERALEGVPLAGRTDPLIIGDALALHGRKFANGEA